MERKPQSIANHAKFDPWFHFTLAPLCLILTMGAIRVALAEGTGEAWWRVGLAVAVLLLTFKARIYSLGVQDRVIRLEEHLRMERVLPADLKPFTDKLERGQLIALRFAPDAELPGLVRRAVDEKLSPKDLKKAIQNWRADYHRV